MKIVLATPIYPPEIGGPATYAKLLEDGLSARGIEIELVKFSEVRHLPKILRHIVYFLRVLRVARHADMVFALDPVSTGLPAMCAARRAGKPFVVKIVGDYAWEQGQQRFGITQNLDEFVKQSSVPFSVWVLRRIQTRVAQNATRIIVPSDYLKGIVATWGIPLEKIEVIYNAVLVGSPGLVPEAVADLPQPRIVTAGRLVPWKGMDGVIDAVAGLRKEGIAASLTVVGDGSGRVPLSVHAEQQLGKGYIFTGVLGHADTLAVMKSADVFVLNSSYEGLSHLLIEALSLGVPTIATAVGGNPEVLTNEENGLLVSEGNTLELVEALTRMLGSDELRSRLGARAVESAGRFSIETMLAATAATLKNI